MATRNQLATGVQVVYKPDFGDIETGFVTSVNENRPVAFCRFWVSGKEGIELRTKANSEPVSFAKLFISEKPIVDRQIVDKLLVDLYIVQDQEEVPHESESNDVWPD